MLVIATTSCNHRVNRSFYPTGMGWLSSVPVSEVTASQNIWLFDAVFMSQHLFTAPSALSSSFIVIPFLLVLSFAQVSLLTWDWYESWDLVEESVFLFWRLSDESPCFSFGECNVIDIARPRWYLKTFTKSFTRQRQRRMIMMVLIFAPGTFVSWRSIVLMALPGQAPHHLLSSDLSPINTTFNGKLFQLSGEISKRLLTLQSQTSVCKAEHATFVLASPALRNFSPRC